MIRPLNQLHATDDKHEQVTDYITYGCAIFFFVIVPIATLI